MKEWKVILATLVLFGTGVVTGGLLVHLTSGKPPRIKQVIPANPPLFSPKGAGHEQRIQYIRNLTRQLDLQPEQAAKIESALQASQQRSKALWETIQPKLNDEVRKSREQIREVLTPEQRKKFDEMNKQGRVRKEGRMEQPKRAGTPALKRDTNAPVAPPVPAPDAPK